MDGLDARCSDNAAASCTGAAAAPYDAPAPPAALAPRLDAAATRNLRVFFLEGHVGPMNDMLAFLHDGLGMNASLVVR